MLMDFSRVNPEFLKAYLANLSPKARAAFERARRDGDIDGEYLRTLDREERSAYLAAFGGEQVDGNPYDCEDAE